MRKFYSYISPEQHQLLAAQFSVEGLDLSRGGVSPGYTDLKTVTGLEGEERPALRARGTVIPQRDRGYVFERNWSACTQLVRVIARGRCSPKCVGWSATKKSNLMHCGCVHAHCDTAALERQRTANQLLIVVLYAHIPS